MLCLDCGFDTDTADLAAVMAVLVDAEERVGRIVAELRRRTEALPPDERELEHVLELCNVLEDARRALLGVPPRAPRHVVTLPIPMYSALAVLSTEASWVQRASRSVSPPPLTSPVAPAVVEAAHALEHADERLRSPYSAGDTSPLS